ncbi:porin [Ferriphaselus sp. R-1]|uniref:porin n=1 Tax=Ferriphaselus sp. R-1 TaxID=1485544 RepID=UPI00068A95B1|nr:porin [Ferriphaselus sp. R-1]
MMYKKLIALAVTAAVSAPALADSNVTVYGLAHVSVDSVKQGAGVDALKVSSNVSKLGFKGSEDIGDGLSAIWQIEQQINIDNSTANVSTLATRNSFAGLKSGAGTVLLGRHDTPYKIATRRLDVFGDYLADNRTLMGGVAGKSVGSSFDGRPTDVLAYITPDLGGFTGAIAYVAGAEGQTLAADKKGSAISVAGMFNMADFYGSLAYEEHTFGTAGTGTIAGAAALAGLKESSAKLGLGYKIADALDLGVAYEKSTDNFGAANANKYGHNAAYVSAKYAFGAHALKLAYTKAGATATANTGATQISAAYENSLSKRTSVYALYTQLNNGSAANYNFATAGSTAGGVATTGLGKNLSAISLGMKHSF